MISRTLPKEEWSKLDSDLLNGWLKYANPEDVRIAVVEDQGKIVGRCLILKMTHLESLWMDETHKNAGVSSALLGQVVKTARELANETVIAGANDGDDKMYSLMARLGAERIPASYFALGIGV